jgi:hypothetical protein
MLDEDGAHGRLGGGGEPTGPTRPRSLRVTAVGPATLAENPVGLFNCADARIVAGVVLMVWADL